MQLNALEVWYPDTTGQMQDTADDDEGYKARWKTYPWKSSPRKCVADCI